MVLLLAVLPLRFQDEAARAGQEPTRRPRIAQVLAGHRLAVKGKFEAPGVFRGEDFELLPPGGRDSVVAPLDEVAPEDGRLRVAGIEVEVPRTADLRGEGGATADLSDFSPGTWVKVDGRLRGRRLRASRVRVESRRSRVTLEGTVDEVESGVETTRLRILGVDVAAPTRARVDIPEALAGRDLESLVEEPPSRRRRTDEDFVPGTIRIGDRITLGGTISAQAERREEFDLDADDDRDRTDLDLRTRLEVVWRPRDDLWVVAGASDAREWFLRDADAEGRNRRTVLRETFVFVRDAGIPGVDLELGRLHFKDNRQWTYDRDLDGLRLSYAPRPFYVEGSVTTVALGGERLEKDAETTNLIAVVGLDLGDFGEVEGYVIDRQDRTSEEDSPFFAGIRARGEPLDGVEPWFEFAYAGGVDDTERIRGFGADAGATVVAAHPLEPSLTLAYAFGSGGDDDPADGDANFRQTGLQDDVDKWNGVTSFRYYGELLDPELSNLEVVTAGVGFRPARRTSLDLVVHRYRQPRPAPFLRDTNLRPPPDGVHAYLGWEWDVVFGWRRIPFLDTEVVFGRFHPGDAFDGERVASYAKLEVRLKF